MKFNIGDKVRFLNEVGDGVVTRILDKSMVMILNDDSFEVPVQESELILLSRKEEVSVSKGNKAEKHSYLIEEELEQEEDDISEFVEIDRIFAHYDDLLEREENTGTKLNLALVPWKDEKQETKGIDIHLINEGGNDISFTFYLLSENGYVPQTKDYLEAETKSYLFSVKADDYNKLKGFYLQYLLYNPEYKGVPDTQEGEIKLNIFRIFKEESYTENDYFEENAMILPVEIVNEKRKLKEISGKEIEDAIREKEYGKKIDQGKAQYRSPKPIMQKEEVDLHIHELVEYDYRNLSNSEILEIQLDHFRKKLDEAILGQKNRIIFIHGIGSGVLRNAIYRVLASDYPKLKYQDASFREYGYGATMIILK